MKSKKILTAISLVVMITILSIGVHGHGGKTDGSGGHYDRSTGEYHYHHGYSAHQHANGECPYDFVDKTDHSSLISSSKKPSKNKISSQNEKEPITFCGFVEDVFYWLLISFVGFGVSLILFGWIVAEIKNEKIRTFCFIAMAVMSLVLVGIFAFKK